MTSQTRRRGTVAWLLNFARPATARLSASTASRLAGHALGAATLALPAWAVGMLATGQAAGAGFVVLTVALTLVAAVAKAVLRYLEQLLGHLAAFGLMGEMRVELLARLAPQAPAVTDGAGAARIQAVAVRDVDRVEVFFAHTIAPAISAVVIPLAAATVAWAVAGPAVGLTVAVVLGLGLGLPLLGASAGQRGACEIATVRADIAQHVADTLRLRDDVRANEAEQVREATLAEQDARLTRALAASGRRAGLRHALANLRVWLGTLGVLVVGVVSATDLAGALPSILLAAALVPGTITSLETVERLATSLPTGLEAARRVRALLEAAPVVVEPVVAGPAAAEPALAEPASVERAAVEPAAATTVSQQAVPALELRDVTFAYPGAPSPTVEGLSLAVARGEFVGVVGATGSGKSTISRLAQRHFDPQRGAVLVDGVDARELGSAEVARRVIVADQDPFVLEGTVRENLRLADDSATDERLRWALDLVELDHGLDAQVGRRGARLSGGQRQRLALARTLVRAAPVLDRCILVLDEATSHQDPLTQARLIARLRELGVTLVVIAHRLETLRDADRTISLKA
ncbi:ABC transporter ATP-binding protein [Gulosibacter faecalis]|uniref:ABC transporter ATP-binding protein n=1 Tax=Gulosibacter faecalis TaxID=272240 RepID=A0ABW5V1N2_9MICO|nr:ABC transporter ATP-binding protein [Gulosibacter faecalis]